MQNNISSLTYKVVAFPEVPHFNTDICVDWAIEMISLGHETTSLLILSSLSKPTNFFETMEYLKAALDELHLKIKTGDDGILSFCSYYIGQIAECINIKSNLTTLIDYGLTKSYENPISDFYLLYWAWGDIEYGNEFQEYWPEANKHNIENLVIATAEKWLTENKAHYRITIL
jgi:hypothetical protein